jgi:hypothetical protein
VHSLQRGSIQAFSLAGTPAEIFADTQTREPEYHMNKFSLGQVVATPAALRALEESGQRPDGFLDRHLTGDWGIVSPDDQRANKEALRSGARLLSAYETKSGVKIWVITEAAGDDGHRASTCVLLPEDY